MTPPTPRASRGFWPVLLLVALGPPIVLMASAVAGLDVVRAQAASAMLNADQKQEMKLHYDRAQRAFDIGKYADAIDEYARVYEIGGSPSMLFNIAQAHRLNNQLPEALRFYRRYLQRSPSAPNRADVEQKIKELERLVDERARGTAAPATPMAAAPPAVVAAPVAPAPAGTPAPAPPPPSPPPPAVVKVQPPPPASTTPSTRVAAAEPPPLAPAAPPGATDSASSGLNGRLLLVVSLLAVGTGGIVLASFEGLSASSKADTITAQSRAGKQFDPAVETSGRRANAIAITSGLVGVAALGVAGFLFFTRPRGPDEGGAAPGAPVISFAPWVSPSSGLIGAGAAWTY